MSKGSAVKDRVDALWHDNPDQVRKHRRWAQSVEAGLKKLKEARTQFHQWRPLWAYTSVSRVPGGKGKVAFDLRFKGQSVADVVIPRGGEVSLSVNSERQKNNAKYFGLELPESASATLKVPWQTSPEARAFRKHFIDLYQRQGTKAHKTEHAIESLILQEMQKRSRAEMFSGTWTGGGIQPVRLAGCFFQFPTPLSASKGQLKPSNGHVDVLARAGGPNLAVWELKRSGEGLGSNPQRQVLGYALTLLKMLRDGKSGERWYRLMGFQRALPKALTVRVAVVLGDLPKQKQEQVTSTLKDYFKKNADSLSRGQDQIVPELIFFKTDNPEDPRQVTIQQVIPLDP